MEDPKLQSDYSDFEDVELVNSAGKQPSSDPSYSSINASIPVLPNSVAKSLLYTLPRELRDRIFAYCLTSHDNLPIEWPSLWRPYGLQPQLLRTCKIIRDEAGPMLYTLNAQMFHHPSDANIFVRAFISPVLGKQITHLNLHIKAQDTRLWTPYLTSTDPVRSVKADFPALKELSIRYRSNKWQHQAPIETNMKHWADDSKLDEITNGLRHVFLGMENSSESQWSWDPSARLNLAGALPEERQRFERQLYDQVVEAQGLQPYVRSNDEPILRVTCACRVHSAHFQELTTPTPATSDSSEATVEDPEALNAPPAPVKDGDVFRGFTAVDLQRDIKKFYDQESGSTDVAQTPFTDKSGVLLSLEIYCSETKKDVAERAA
jgi:hypothetical protein